MPTAYIALGSNLDSEHGTAQRLYPPPVERLGRLGRVAALLLSL